MAAPASGHGDKRHDPETQDEEIHCLLWAHTGAPSVTIDRVRASASVHVSWDSGTLQLVEVCGEHFETCCAAVLYAD